MILKRFCLFLPVSNFKFQISNCFLLLMPSLPFLPPRKSDSHKGDYGRALLIGGSRGMAGAISLAGVACLRSGAGLVRIAAPDNAVDTIAAFEPSYMLTPLPLKEDGELNGSA